MYNVRQRSDSGRRSGICYSMMATGKVKRGFADLTLSENADVDANKTVTHIKKSRLQQHKCASTARA